MRAVKFFIILGFAFLLASFVPSPFASRGNLIDRGYYECFLVNGSGNLLVEVSGADYRNISLYVLDYEDTAVLVREESLENTTPLFFIENVFNFSGIISLPRPDWYGVVVLANIANPALTNMRYDIYITRPVPYLVPILLFTISEVLGIGLLLYRRFEKKNRTKQ
ncbi:MAG: hypothetical protein KGD60_10735 [Candidatus Thorarchaeota archaeon]|nr:hypothetical protein [Candidatus Thorarchaeota archaeon]